MALSNAYVTSESSELCCKTLSLYLVDVLFSLSPGPSITHDTLLPCDQRRYEIQYGLDKEDPQISSRVPPGPPLSNTYI